MQPLFNLAKFPILRFCLESEKCFIDGFVMIFQSLQIFVHVVLTSRGVAHCGIGCDVGEEREPALDHEWRISIELVPISLGFVLCFVQVLAPSRPLCSATGWV